MDKSHIMTVPTPSGNSIDTEAMRFMLLSTPGAWEQYQAFLKFQSSEKIQDDKPVESNSQCSMIVPTPSQAHGNSSMGELTPCLTKICLISNTFIGLHKTLVSQSPLPMPDISQTQNNRFGMRDTQDESFNTQRAINDSQPLHDLTDTTINNHEDVELDKSPCLSEQEPIHPTPEPSRKSVENNSDDEMDTDSVQSDDDHEIDDAAICDFESDDEGPPEECSKDLNLDAARKKKIRVCLPELMGTVNNRRESCQRRKVVASHSFEFLGHMDKALSKYHAIKQVKPAVQKVYNWIKHKEPDWKWSRIVVIKVMRQICQDNVKNANKAVNAKKRLQDIEVLKGRPKGKASKNKLKQASQENTAEFLVGQSTNTPLLNETQPITQVETQVSITSTTSASAESSTSSNTIIDDRYTRTPERNDNDLNNQTDIIMSTELTDLPMNLDFSHRKNNAPALLPEMKASPSLTQMATSTGFKLPNNGVIVKPKPTSSSSANDAKNVKSQTWMQVMNIPVTFTSAYNPVPGESFYVIRTPMGKHFKFALRYEFNTFQEAMATFLNVDELEVQKGFHYTIEGHSECILSFPDEYARMILKIANRNPIVVSIRPQDSEVLIVLFCLRTMTYLYHRRTFSIRMNWVHYRLHRQLLVTPQLYVIHISDLIVFL